MKPHNELKRAVWEGRQAFIDGVEDCPYSLDTVNLATPSQQDCLWFRWHSGYIMEHERYLMNKDLSASKIHS